MIGSLLFDLLLYCGVVLTVLIGIVTAVGMIAMIHGIKEIDNDRCFDLEREVDDEKTEI